MVEGAVLDLLSFYQRDLREGREGRKALGLLGIDDPEVADHFGLGYASGRAVSAAGAAQYEELKRLGLAYKRRERMHGCVVVPVYDRTGRLVDMLGLRPYRSGVRYFNWRNPSRGLVGVEKLGDGGEVVLCDAPLWALQVRMHRPGCVLALRAARDGSAELAGHQAMLRECGVRRVYLLSRQQMGVLAPVLERAGMEVVQLQMPLAARAVTAEMLSEVGRRRDAGGAQLGVTRAGERLTFRSGETAYMLESNASMCKGMRTQVKAVRAGVAVIDRLDLASAGARQKFARACAARFGVSSRTFEDDLCAVAERLDAEGAEVAGGGVPERREPTAEEMAAGERLLKSETLLAALAGAMEKHFGVVGEEVNRKLAVLVAASRLLPRPLGAIVRGPAGCGKSALVHAAARLLPPSEVLYFSRLTAQALYFMPREQLRHKVLVVDEYEGLQESEYALRTMMSSGTLSLAITLREGGRAPVTRTVELDASLAVLVSSTRAINIENLSRFIELGMDDSAAQNRMVMEGLATRLKGQPGTDEELEAVRLALGLLAPCSVRVPYADKLVYSSGQVLARRQYAKLLGLISAHAALYQHQRRRLGGGGEPVLEAEAADYAAVHPLLGHVMEHFEERLSPPAVKLLGLLQSGGRPVFTRKNAMEWTGWSYGKTHGVLRELTGLDLIVPDTRSNGVERIFEAAPFRLDGNTARLLPAPEAVR